MDAAELDVWNEMSHLKVTRSETEGTLHRATIWGGAHGCVVLLVRRPAGNFLWNNADSDGL
jgi:hypothetical protein